VMENNQTLRKIVAELTKRSPDEIHSGLVLDDVGLRGSLKRALLDATIQRAIGKTDPAVYSVGSYGELEAALLGKASSQAMPLPAPESASPAPAASTASPIANSTALPPGVSVACGVDIEEVRNLPETPDYWEHDFYRQSFSMEEIAYCLLKSDPRVHFAARWAAKEALKKCDPAFLNAELKSLSLVHRPDGSTYLARQAKRVREPLPHAVSISHTDSYAVATVMRVQSSLPISAGEIEETAPVVEPDATLSIAETPPAPESKRTRVLLAVAALAGAGSALWFLFQ
jgi:holo-[acyl-carrier protein] synthase